VQVSKGDKQGSVSESAINVDIYIYIYICMYVGELDQSCSKSTYYPIIPKFSINEGAPPKFGKEGSQKGQKTNWT
jgi:hypothetical protein